MRLLWCLLTDHQTLLPSLEDMEIGNFIYSVRVCERCGHLVARKYPQVRAPGGTVYQPPKPS